MSDDRDFDWAGCTDDADREVCVEPFAPEMEAKKRLFFKQQVGQGGTGVIEKVFDSNLLRNVARKMVRPDMMDDQAICGYLVEEAQITAQLDHQQIVPVHELGIDEAGHSYFTMKLVKGLTFRELIQKKDFAERTKSEVFEQLQTLTKVCDAVAFAHSRGVIHRDLKTDNIMVGEYGEVYLMDWGLAKLKKKQRPSRLDMKDRVLDTRRVPNTRKEYVIPDEDGMVRATPSYMAPEQARGDAEAVDERTDVFCLGGVLYEILTCKPPYTQENVQKIVFAALEGRIVPPEETVDFDLPPRLCQIAMKALSRFPDDRYQSVADLKRELEGFLQSGWQFKRRVFKAGELIVKEGEQGDEAYIITKGTCRAFRLVDGEKIILQDMEAGDVFGEIAVFAKQPRGATVEAIGEVAVMVVKGEYFDEDLGMNSWLGVFVKALAERLLETTDRATELEKCMKDKAPSGFLS
ncbi:MAG: protein kinase [Proteobacteria bacterium]|nr:protein kinase [Pseudomonadota bacterium]